MDGKTQSLQEMSSIQLTGTTTVPPGFRFHPTDEELVGYYLTKKVASSKIDLDVIREIDLYKLEPWDLQERCRIGSAEQHEWYFFSHKDKKYPTGTRTNRATTAGFWKATGRDKPIFAKVKLIGMRKTLVFYKGRAPNGQKSDWIMHEYRLEDDINNTATNEEGWVVCRVFKKRSIVKKPVSDYECYDEEPSSENRVSSSSSGAQVAQQQYNSVKQESEGGGVYFPFGTYDSFSQLPRLESPKRSCGEVPVSTPIPPAAAAAEDHSSLQASSGYQLNELEELVQLHSKALAPQGDVSSYNFPGFHDEIATAWGMEDRLLQHVAEVVEDEESRFAADLSQRICKTQQHTDYSYDSVDLWGFNR